MERPRVGVVFFRHPYLVPCERFDAEREAFVAGLLREGLSVVLQEIIEDDIDLEKAEQKVGTTQIDLLIYPFLSWGVEERPLLIARQSTTPLVLVCDEGHTNSLPLSGYTATASHLRQIGRTFGYVVGPLQEPRTHGEVARWARVARVCQGLRRVRVGLIGQSCPGMLDAGADETSLIRLGPRVIRLDALELVDAMEAADKTSVKAAREALIQSDWVVHGPADGDLDSASRFYLALRHLCSHHHLTVVGVRCWPELRFKRRTSACLAFGRLWDDGIVGVCENDALSGVTMWILEQLTGKPAFVGDLSTIIPECNSLRLWHCGSASPALCPERFRPRLLSHPWAHVGVGLGFPLESGEITIAKLTRPLRGGRHRLFAFIGESLSLGDTEVTGNVVNIRPSLPVQHLVNQLVEMGIEHHLVVGYGNVEDDLRRLALLSDVDMLAPLSHAGETQ